MRQIFVFGSNTAGIHGAGAANFAYRFYGAEWGVGRGPTGECYALPTKDKHIETRSLNEIKEEIDTFMSYALLHKEDFFKITRVGCGLAGYSWENDIRPLFPETLPSNCTFI